MICKYFPQAVTYFLMIFLIVSHSVFLIAKIFHFYEVQLFSFVCVCLWIVLLMSYIRTLCSTQGHEDFLLRVLLVFFKSMTDFELNFVLFEKWI